MTVCTGRCYCGKTTFEASKPPITVAFCHCFDCKRSSGAPVAAYAAFEDGAVTFTPDEGKTVGKTKGAVRSFCPDCGSPLTGRYAYLPDTVYVAIGLFEDADAYPPELHSHAECCLTWIQLSDSLPRHAGSARSSLNEK